MARARWSRVRSSSALPGYAKQWPGKAEDERTRALMFPLTKTETKISVNENNMNSLTETKTETEMFVERKTETETEKAQTKKTN